MAGNSRRTARVLMLSSISVLILLVFVLAGSIWSRWHDLETIKASSRRATADTESILTGLYGNEARESIRKFRENWHSFEAHADPSIQSRLATKTYLENFGYARLGEEHLLEQPSWLVTQSATVTSVTVIEYRRDYLKAIACITEQINEVTTSGTLVEPLPPYHLQGIFAFVYDEDAWKLAGQIEITDRDGVLRDWEYFPDWLKMALGDVPGIMQTHSLC